MTPLKKLSRDYIKQEAQRARVLFGLKPLDHVRYDIDVYVDKVGASIVPKIKMRQQTSIDACWGANFKELYIDHDHYLETHSLRWRFTIAHELGHFFLHRSRWKQFKDQKSWMTNVLGNEQQRRIEEKEANIFAGYFLFPNELLELEFNSLLASPEAKLYSQDGFSDDEVINILSDKLANTFKVSESCMQIRIDTFRSYDKR